MTRQRPSLSAAQLRALEALDGLRPEPTLTGGAALAGVYLGHRTTRVLDLFFRQIDALGHVPDEAARRLRAHGFEVVVQERGEVFTRLFARVDDEAVIIDLVADPVPTIEPASVVRLGAATVRVDTLREILANKLCALLGRSELRDVIDVEALLAEGLELEPALRDAGGKDGGFTALQLAWVLSRFPLAKVAAAEGMPSSRVDALAAFLRSLTQQVLDAAKPDSSAP